MDFKNSFSNSLFKATSLFQIIVGLLVIIAIALILILLEKDSIPEYWSYIEPIVGLSTLIAAVFIWYNEKKQDWREALPKKMNIEYILDGNKYWSVRFAPLTSEQDIRAWGQSIAKTILNDKNNIDFKGFEIISSETIKDRGGFFIKLYQVRFYLIKPIASVVADSILSFDSHGIAQIDTTELKV